VLAQCAILVVFLIGKLGIEKLGAKVASVVGADAMPNVIFIATLAYEVNLCIALGSGFGIWPFLELILFDLVENTYCLVCLSRSSAEVGAQGIDPGWVFKVHSPGRPRAIFEQLQAL